MDEQKVTIEFELNGRAIRTSAAVRDTLADVLRHGCHLKGVHLGCEHGVCGACTVELDGRTVRSCLLLAPQAQGCSVVTVEGLAEPDGSLSLLQSEFSRTHALQCGFCTPGFLMVARELLAEDDTPLTEEEVRERISGNICRCTGYQNIVDAILSTAEQQGRAVRRERATEVPS